MQTPNQLRRSSVMPRREFLGRTASTLTARSLVGAAVVGCGAVGCGIVGCRPEKTKQNAAPSVTQTVPLRIAFLGSDDDMDAIRRSWSAVSEQPLKLVSTQLDRARPIDTASFLNSARRSDVVIYPMAMMGEASGSEAVIDFSDGDLDSIGDASGALLVGVRNATRYAGNVAAIPLGARLPALLSTVPTKQFSDWKQYDEWVDSDLEGMAAEPLAPGWAAAMFLWRAASTIEGTWLFGRENLDPVVAAEPYVHVLQQMKKTATRYKSGRISPDEIWQGLATGQLKAGIGFPFSQPIDGISIGDLPGKSEGSRILLDLFTPVVSISTGCRQSAAAKQFVAWLCGGDGSANMRQQIASFTITREPRLNIETDSATGQRSAYDTWLRQQLETTMTLPVLQIHAASQYYQSLDKEVRRCLDGDATPTEALNEVANRWREITKEVGVEKQMREWRRCQGMRA